MSYQYTDPYGNPHVRGWGNDFTEEERREREIGEFNWKSPNYTGPKQAPGRTNPEDYIMDGPAPGRGYADVQPDPTFTGSDWLNQQLRGNNAQDWLKDLLFRSTGASGGTLAQDLFGGNVGAGSSPAALGFLQEAGSKLKDFLNRGPFPGSEDDPRDSQGTTLIDGKHPGAIRLEQRNRDLQFKRPMF